MSHFEDTADSAFAQSSTPAKETEARKALLGSALGYAMDGFDLLILGFMLRAIGAALGLTQTQGASLVTATLVGAVIGGIGFGMLSDRLGRVLGTTGMTVILQLTSFLLVCIGVQIVWNGVSSLLKSQPAGSL